MALVNNMPLAGMNMHLVSCSYTVSKAKAFSIIRFLTE